MAGDWLTYNYVDYAWSPYGHLWRTLRRLSVVKLFSSHSLQNLPKYVKKRYLNSSPTVQEEEIGSERGKEIIEGIRGIFSPSLSLGMCDYFPVLRWIGYKGLERNVMLLHKKRDEFLQHLVDEIRPTEEKRKTNLIETLLSVQASEPEFYSDDVIKSILVVMFSAGTDTSAVTLEWAMSRVLREPEKLVRLRQEINEKVGHDRLINDSDLPKLPYLGCVVDETLRLHPSAPLLLPRISSEECVVGGYNIPKGTILMVNAWAMHRDPNLRDEADKFVPERFETEKEGHKFVPFGIGRRGCPGVGMALGAFVQCFEWERPVSDHHAEMEFNANLQVILHKVKPLEAVCFVRNQPKL